MRLKKIYFYKCDVINCNNKVYSPGAICSECIEKLVNDLWQINYCSICGKLIDFSNDEIDFSTFSTKMNKKICKYCENSFNDELF